jgi:hypothetical protein
MKQMFGNAADGENEILGGRFSAKIDSLGAFSISSGL